MKSSAGSYRYSQNGSCHGRRRAARSAISPLAGRLLGFLLGSMVFAFPVLAFKTFNKVGGTIHQQISFVLMGEGFSESSFQMIDNGNTEQDVPETENFTDATHHFDNNQILPALSHVNDLRDQFIAKAATANTDKSARETVLRIFGAMLHAVQDFYSHSNYLELNLKAREVQSVRLGEIPIVNWDRIGSYTNLKTGYFFYESPTYNETFDSIKTITGNLRLQFPSVKFKSNEEYRNLLTHDSLFYTYDEAIENAIRPDGEMHYLVNKDDTKSPMGRLVHPESKILLHQYAFDLAVRETKRQWQLLEAAILSTYGEERGGNIVLAIKRNVDIKEEKEAPPIAANPPDMRDGLATQDNLPAGLDDFLNAWEYENAYFAKALQTIKKNREQTRSDFVSELSPIRDQIDRLATLVNRARAFLTNVERDPMKDSTVLGNGGTDLCRSSTERILDLRRLLKRAEKDEQDVEKKLYSAQQLAKACKDRTSLSQAEALYKESSALVTSLHKDLAFLATMLNQWEDLGRQLDAYRAKAREADTLWNDLDTLPPTLILDQGRYSGRTGRLDDDIDDTAGDLSRRLDNFRNAWSPKVPVAVLAPRLEKLQMYMNALRSQRDASADQYRQEWAEPLDKLKEQDARLRQEAGEIRNRLYAIFQPLQRGFASDDCLNDVTRNLREITEKTDTLKTLADLALTKLGKGYEAMRDTCKAQLSRLDSAPLASASNGVKSGPKSIKPVHLLRFWPADNPKDVRFLLYAYPPDKNGIIHLADGSGGLYHYPGQDLGLYKDEDSLCAVLRGYQIYSVDYNLYWWGVSCPKDGPVAPPHPSAVPPTPIVNTPGKSSALPGGVANPPGKHGDLRQRQEEEQRRQAEQARIRKEEDARLQAEQTRLRKEEEAHRAQAAATKRQEEEQRHQAEQARVRKEEEARRVQAAARQRQEEEARRQAEQARIRKEEETRRAQAAATKRQEEDQRHQAEQARIRKEEEARHQAEQVRIRKEEEARRQAEQARIRKEEETRRAQAEARQRQEEEARRQTEQARIRKEGEARRQAEQARIRKEEEARRRQAEEKKRQEEEQRRRAEAEKAKRDEAQRRPRW